MRLERARLADHLRGRLQNRPGILELIEGNILHDEAVAEAVRTGSVEYRRTSEGQYQSYHVYQSRHSELDTVPENEVTGSPDTDMQGSVDGEEGGEDDDQMVVSCVFVCARACVYVCVCVHVRACVYVCIT